MAHDLIAPIVRERARELGFSAPERAPELATWKEVHAGGLDRGILEERLAAVEQGHRFVFEPRARALVRLPSRSPGHELRRRL